MYSVFPDEIPYLSGPSFATFWGVLKTWEKRRSKYKKSLFTKKDRGSQEQRHDVDPQKKKSLVLSDDILRVENGIRAGEDLSGIFDDWPSQCYKVSTVSFKNDHTLSIPTWCHNCALGEMERWTRNESDNGFKNTLNDDDGLPSSTLF